VNANELRDRLVARRSIFQTSSDTEVVLHLYARSRAAAVEDALVESISQVTGAFSLALLTKDRLIAARDPHGFRPLALGQLDGAYIVCSETCALDLIGATYVRDVEPGEVLIIARRHAIAAPVSAGAAGALRLRARLLRASRQLRLRHERQRGAHRARTDPAPRIACRRRRRQPDSRLGRLRARPASPRRPASRWRWG
jgi:asparagine synthetase B (glutamine-hydrolysing)